MRRKKNLAGRKNERGIVIMLVAVVMLFVIGAMAALSIDVVTIYTARSEAQLAADAAALAGARVLANSGMTSDTTGGLTTSAEALAKTVATQVAQNDLVGGKAAGVTISFGGTPPTNPTVTVKVQRTDLPTFFARIWGSKQLTVGASATAEAYNPSAPSALSTGGATPVAPLCVKPWLLPNMDPSPAGTTIFDATTGAITPTAAALLGHTTVGLPPTARLRPRCTTLANCSAAPLLAPVAWRYYPGNPSSFPPPTSALPTCTPALTTPYEESIAGCVQTPIACNIQVQIANSPYTTPARETEAADAVNCLTHATANPNDADQVDQTVTPSPPFQFLAGNDNPIPGAAGNDVMVSSSLVTVPVFNSTGTAPTSPVTIIGFVQLFLNPDGNETPNGGGNNGRVNTTVINMAGCGTSATGNPILGNGASPVAVRLISP